MSKQEKESKVRQVVLITGGTSGIGFATAKKFIQDGAIVVIAGRDVEKGKRAEKELGKQARFMPVDVRKIASCRVLTEKVGEVFQRIDVLVNAAGIYQESALEEITEDLYEDVMATNAKGTMFMSQAALPYLKAEKGVIVNVSSDAGVHGNYFCALYAASKGAVNLFTKSLALEVASFGVRVNAVCPGDVLTPMTEKQLQKLGNRSDALQEMESVYPMQRIGTPEEVASVIAFLASKEAGFVTGACWSVDGGLTA